MVSLVSFDSLSSILPETSLLKTSGIFRNSNFKQDISNWNLSKIININDIIY